MFQELCFPSVRHLYLDGVPWLQLSGKLCLVESSNSWILEFLFDLGRQYANFLNRNARMGQRLKEYLLACILLLSDCVWTQSALVLNEAGAGLERGILLGGKTSISTPTEPWSWLCTSPPSKECVVKAHSPSGALTQAVWKGKMNFLSTGLPSEEHGGQLHSAVCSSSSKSERFPRVSSCVIALLLLPLQYNHREKQQFNQGLWSCKCCSSKCTHMEALCQRGNCGFYISNRNLLLPLGWLYLM